MPGPARAAEPATGNPNPCALGEALSAAGEVDAAKKALVQVMKAEPGSECASRELKELNPKKTEPTAATSFAEEVTGSIPTTLVCVGLLLVAWYGLLLLCRIRWLKELVVRLWKPGRYVKHTLRPRLDFVPFADDAVEGKPGAPLMARFKDRLRKMREEALDKEAPEYDLDFGNPREEFADQVSDSKPLETALASAAEVSDQTKIVAAFLKALSAWLPIRRYTVSGSFEPPAKSGAALTLTLEEEGRSESATRFQGPAGDAKPEAADYMVLADPAAVWVQYMIACSLAGEEPDAARAESQALLREGLDRYQREDLNEARQAFERAIILDHTNWGAYVSLAVAEARIGRDYDKSIASILTGIERLKAADA